VDAGPDTSVKPKDAGKDTGPPPYVPQGTKCVRAADAGAPLPWVRPVDDAGTDAGVDAGDDSGTDAGDDGGTDGGSAIISADLLRPPPVVSSDGSVASLPVFVPITFDGDPLRDEIEDFVASVGCSSYWHAVATPYGIGDGISATPIRLPEVPPTTMTDAQVQTWLAKKINGDPSFPKPSVDVVYVIFFPQETVIDDGSGKSCSSFAGYHFSTDVGGKNAPYAVIPRCGGSLDSLTAVTSHELIEYATDPTPGQGGYLSVANEWIAWSLLGGSEVADMCEHARYANFTPNDYPFAVQRSWSNEQAFLGNDPCIPPDGPVWFIGTPILPDMVTVSDYGQTIQAHGLKLAAGKSTTIDVRMQSSGAGTWTVSAQDISVWLGSSPQLKFAFDKTTGKAGDVLHLTVTRTGTNSTYKANPFMLRSSNANQEHLWFGIVGD